MAHRHQTNIIEACRDRDLLDVDLSDAQSALLKAIYALPMTDAELALFREATGLTEAPTVPFRSISVLAGRRSGKSSRACAPLAVFESCIAEHAIPPNERGVVLVLGPTERQARITFRMIDRMISRSPKLRGLVESTRAGGENEIQLSNSIDIRVVAANQRTVRGDLIVAGILEESCFFKDSESGQYNLQEVIDALRPALLTLPDSKLIRVSSPWVAEGPMHEDFIKRAERPETLCWKLPSWTMNPSISSARLWFEKARDPQAFAREYGCEFLAAAAQLIPSELIDRAVARGVPFFASSTELRAVAALDPSSKGADCFAFALAHKSNDGRVAVDWVEQWRPPGQGRFLDYAEVLPQIFERMTAYGSTKAYSDQICAAALSAAFAEKGFDFEQVSTLGSRAAHLYRSVRQLFVAKKVDLPDNAVLIEQLKKLEERLGEGGSSRVEARSGHDDVAIAACLAIYKASLEPESREPMTECLKLYDSLSDDGPASGDLGHPYQPGTGGWRRAS
jgi:hypothetical protein